MTADKSLSSVLSKVSHTVAEIAGVETGQIDGRTELVMDLNLDSLALFEIVIDLEEYYDLQISDEDVDRIKTVDDIVNFIVHKRPANRPGKQE